MEGRLGCVMSFQISRKRAKFNSPVAPNVEKKGGPTPNHK
jgi:hypothetical protein